MGLYIISFTNFQVLNNVIVQVLKVVLYAHLFEVILHKRLSVRFYR